MEEIRLLASRDALHANADEECAQKSNLSPGPNRNTPWPLRRRRHRSPELSSSDEATVDRSIHDSIKFESESCEGKSSGQYIASFIIRRDLLVRAFQSLNVVQFS